ncbi:acylphosphatase [Aliivibrio sp. 1S128]|jgi:acylphosphatase|uniref:acylphosphatase n=1 Tax=Aliivibrio sp. 1S128 TaxID=1840085 RepID=UPI00080EA7D7|nr:acylphosphatase [Aliivibrio sp. 1S128]OCH19942.1 acylphosphatase [Aliivibrio sp. 1S128]
MSQKSFKFSVKGKVQRVGFRFHTAHEAIKLGLTGYARNQQDGSVEVFACGDEDNIEKLALWLKKGPQLSRVDSVEKADAEWQELSDFKMY